MSNTEFKKGARVLVVGGRSKLRGKAGMVESVYQPVNGEATVTVLGDDGEKAKIVARFLVLETTAADTLDVSDAPSTEVPEDSVETADDGDGDGDETVDCCGVCDENIHVFVLSEPQSSPSLTYLTKRYFETADTDQLLCDVNNLRDMLAMARAEVNERLSRSGEYLGGGDGDDPTNPNNVNRALLVTNIVNPAFAAKVTAGIEYMIDTDNTIMCNDGEFMDWRDIAPNAEFAIKMID